MLILALTNISNTVSSINITAPYQGDMRQDINIIRNLSKQTKEDIKQYQSMTERRLNVLEKKSSDYDSANIVKLNKTLTDTRNTVLHYHPDVIVVTKDNGSYHSGNKLYIFINNVIKEY